MLNGIIVCVSFIALDVIDSVFKYSALLFVSAFGHKGSYKKHALISHGFEVM